MGGSIQRLKQFVKNQKGFTLIELMAVLAILALILLIAVPAGGAMIEKAKKSADESSIALMEDAGEKAHVDKLPFDTDVINEEGHPEDESYKIPTLVEEGYLKLEEDSKFFAPENYVKKKNKGGEFIYKGIGSGDDTAGEPETPAYAAIACEEAEALGYTCIYTADELNDIRNTPTGKFIMMNDIDLAKFAAWTPIGNSTTPFKGELNGNGYKIQNLTMDQAATVGYTDTNFGLFGRVAFGTFQNIVIEDYTQAVNNRVSAGALIGYVATWSSQNPDNKPVLIKNVDITGIATLGGTGGGQIAGLIGYLYNENADVTIDDVSFGGSIVNTNTQSYDNVASGLIGQMDTESTTRPLTVNITSIALNNIDINGTALAVGLVDESNALGNGTTVNISDISVTGKLESGADVAGLVGQLNADNSKYAYNVSNVKMAAALHSRGNMNASAKISGLFGTIYTDDAIGTTTVDTVEVSGAMTGPVLTSGTPAIAGFSAYYSGYDGIQNLTVQNVDISSPMTGSNRTTVAGFVANYQPSAFIMDKSIVQPVSTHAFSNINVTGAMTGKNVSGFVDNLNVNALSMAFNIEGVNISGELSGVTTAGLIRNNNVGSGRYTQNIKNVDIDSKMVATANASGLIDLFSPWGSSQHDVVTTTISGININGNLAGAQVSGVIGQHVPGGALLNMNFTTIAVNGALTGTTVSGFSSDFSPNAARNQQYAHKFVLDGFVFKGQMVAGNSVSGMFGNWNNDTTNYTNYTGLKDLLDYTIQNVTLDGTVAVSNGATGSHGSLIGTHYAEKRDNTYLFKNVTLSNEATITNEQPTFKKGIIANPAATSAELIFDNVK